MGLRVLRGEDTICCDMKFAWPAKASSDSNGYEGHDIADIYRGGANLILLSMRFVVPSRSENVIESEIDSDQSEQNTRRLQR